MKSYFEPLSCLVHGEVNCFHYWGMWCVSHPDDRRWVWGRKPQNPEGHSREWGLNHAWVQPRVPPGTQLSASDLPAAEDMETWSGHWCKTSLSKLRKGLFERSAADPGHCQKVGHPSPCTSFIWAELQVLLFGVIKNVPNIIRKVNVWLFI